MTNQADKFDEWAIIEVMGHVRLGGRVSEATLAGAAFIRVDVPEIGDRPGFTRFFGPSAIYSISPVSEDIARRMAVVSYAEPVQRYELPRLPSGEGGDDEPEF